MFIPAAHSVYTLGQKQRCERTHKAWQPACWQVRVDVDILTLQDMNSEALHLSRNLLNHSILSLVKND